VWLVREYQGVKMSGVELDRIVSEEILRDDGIRHRLAESGRPLRSHATGMSDDDLLAKLRGLGVDADRERRAWPLARASRTQGWLGLVRRCAVSETWWRRMA
jgi:hypothetical protein